MTYLFLYIISLIIVCQIYRVGWYETLKQSITILVPSILIIIFNLKAGRLLFKSPIIGVLSILPSSIFIYKASQPLVYLFINKVANIHNKNENFDDVIDTDSVKIDD